MPSASRRSPYRIADRATRQIARSAIRSASHASRSRTPVKSSTRGRGSLSIAAGCRKSGRISAGATAGSQWRAAGRTPQAKASFPAERETVPGRRRHSADNRRTASAAKRNYPLGRTREVRRNQSTRPPARGRRSGGSLSGHRAGACPAIAEARPPRHPTFSAAACALRWSRTF